ncbi:hypothetical protein, partial [uncultured Sphingorhabdus sp.]|uniref:hypothetical protein n=1 Tax=uncultured Sphingorhabdus sp. TaxID=1686106 RepID=UPI00262037C0
MRHLFLALDGFISACRADALTLSVGGLFILASLIAMANIGIYGFPLDGSVSLLLTFAATAV